MTGMARMKAVAAGQEPGQADARPERPLRPDAQRNQERLVTAAREVFAKYGGAPPWTPSPSRPASAWGPFTGTFRGGLTSWRLFTAPTWTS